MERQHLHLIRFGVMMRVMVGASISIMFVALPSNGVSKASPLKLLTNRLLPAKDSSMFGRAALLRLILQSSSMAQRLNDLVRRKV